MLCNIQVFAKAIPSLFAPYYEDFFISSSDTYQIRSLKLDILSYTATASSISAILREFQVFFSHAFSSPVNFSSVDQLHLQNNLILLAQILFLSSFYMVFMRNLSLEGLCFCHIFMTFSTGHYFFLWFLSM